MELTRHEEFFGCIEIDVISITPKYLQLAEGVIRAIAHEHLRQGDFLPSLNELSCRFELGRDTAEKAYNHLKRLGVIAAVAGKGYYVTGLQLKYAVRVCLLFNKLSVHKKMIYDAFIATLGSEASVDFYVYNNDFSVFKRLLKEKRKGYTHYVIIPHFVDGEQHAAGVINSIPKDKLVLLDKKMPGVTGSYGLVYENFQGDISWALDQMLHRLVKYQRIKVVFPENSYYPREIPRGIRHFCIQHAFEYIMVTELEKERLEIGDVWICVSEEDLVPLLEKVQSCGLKLGSDLGLISYNETPLKKMMLDGITTVSTDFMKMGIMAAEMVLSRKVEQVKLPFSVVLRDSL